MANVNYTVPASVNSSTAYGSDTLSTTLELGDTLTLKFGTQGSNWTFSQADSFFNSTDVGGSHSTDSVQNTTDDYVIDCDGSYPSGSQTTLNIFKSANTGSSPYLTLTVNTRSLDSTITKDLIHNGNSINGFPIYYSPNGNVTFSYTNGGAYTRYRVITTSASSSPSGTVINGRGCGNSVGTSGTVDIEYKVTGNELCNIEGSQVSYKVQYRPRNLASTYQDTGTTFTLTNIVSSPGTISVSNAGNSSQTETVTVSCAIDPPTDCILEFSTSSSFSSDVLTADGNREADFSQARNSTVTYYARFRNTTTNAATFGSYPSVSHTVNYLPLNDNEISMSVQSVNVAPNYSGSVGAFTYTDGGASAEYRLVSNDTPAFEVDGAQSGSSGSWTVSSSELPPVNTTWTYFVQGQRRESQGGQPNSWAQTTITGSAANELTIFRQNYTAADTTFTTTSPTINWDAASFNTTLTGVQIGDEVQVTLNSDIGVVLEDWTAITSTTQVITCNAATVNSTNLPNGQTTTCRVRVRRPTSNSGDGNVAGFQTLTVTRDYREGTFGSVAVTTPAFADRTIGAQEFIAYGGTQQDVRITGSGVISGATYICRINSGTTSGGATSGIVYSRVASGTEPNAATTAGGLSVSQLPAVNSTVEYIVKCIVPTNLGGDGTTEHDCTTLTIPLPGSTLTFDMTRSNYVQPDETTSQMTITGTGVVSTGFQQWLIANNNTTTNPSLGVATTETNQKYRINNGFTPGNASEVVYYSFGTGNSSLSATITNSDIVTGVGRNYFLFTQVPEVEDGEDDSVWYLVTSDGTTLVRAFIDREAALVAPTITTTSTSINSADYSKVVPWIKIADTGAAQDAGNLQLAFSTITSTPTNWYNVDTGGLNKDGWYFSIDASYSRASQTVYIGVRRQSAVTSAATTPAYSNVSITSTTNLITPGGSNADGYLNQNNGFFNADYILSNNEIRLFAADSLNETVTFESLGNPTGDTVDVDDSSAASTFFFTNTEFRSQYGIDITSGTTSGNLTVGDTVDSYLMPTGNTGGGVNRTFTLANPGDLPALGNTVNYKFWRRQTSANGGDGTKQYPSQAALVAEFFARRFQQADETITVTGVRQTLANNHSTDLVLTIADGNSSTDYQLYSQGATYDTRVGNGTLTATNPGELPTAGNTRSYNIQYRQSGTGDPYQNASGTGTSFTLGRLDPMNLGTLSNPVAIESPVDSATIILDGAVGNITALLTKNSGGGTVRLSKNNQTYANSTASGTSITVVEGDTLSVRAESPSTYSNTTTCTLTLTQDSVTIFSDTFSFTTEASTSGGGGGDGGTGDYGLELRDASNNVIITNSDLIGDFCYDATITIGQGSYTAVGPALAASKGGNTVLILTDLNPFTAAGRVQAELINNGKQVRLTIADNQTLSAAQPYKVVVFHFPQ